MIQTQNVPGSSVAANDNVTPTRESEGTAQRENTGSKEQSTVVSGSIEDIKNRWAALINQKERDKSAEGWKKKTDGTFNTNRLLIDAAGGTVVGAGAGILTNVLMKNAQLKSGYENIQCTFGNGGSASYGETFIMR